MHTNSKTDMLYNFAVEAVFVMSDSSTFFVGVPDRQIQFMSPAKAEIIRAGAVVGSVDIDAERMPGPPPKRLFTLVSNKPFDVQKYGEQFTLRCTIVR